MTRRVWCPECLSFEFRQATESQPDNDFPLVEKAKFFLTAVGITVAGYLLLVAWLVQ